MKHPSSQRIDNGDTINDVVEKLNTNDLTFFISRKDFNHIPSHSKSPSVKIHIISHVLIFNEFFQKIISLHLVPRKEHRSEEHTSELQSRENLVCRLLLEK